MDVASFGYMMFVIRNIYRFFWVTVEFQYQTATINTKGSTAIEIIYMSDLFFLEFVSISFSSSLLSFLSFFSRFVVFLFSSRSLFLFHLSLHSYLSLFLFTFFFLFFLSLLLSFTFLHSFISLLSIPSCSTSLCFFSLSLFLLLLFLLRNKTLEPSLCCQAWLKE